MVYLIHFEKPYKGTRHYIGYCRDSLLEKRLEHHRMGRGSCLMRAVTRAGIGWEVVRTWPGADGNFERLLKNRKKAAELCPVCDVRAMNHGKMEKDKMAI